MQKKGERSALGQLRQPEQAQEQTILNNSNNRIFQEMNKKKDEKSMEELTKELNEMKIHMIELKNQRGYQRNYGNNNRGYQQDYRRNERYGERNPECYNCGRLDILDHTVQNYKEIEGETEMNNKMMEEIIDVNKGITGEILETTITGKGTTKEIFKM